MGDKLFKLRSKPVKPKRKDRCNDKLETCTESVGLKDLLDWACGNKYDLSHVTISVRGMLAGMYLSDFTIAADYDGPEPDNMFKDRMKIYNAKMIKYKKWQKDNKAEIDKALKKKIAKELNKKIRALRKKN